MFLIAVSVFFWVVAVLSALVTFLPLTKLPHGAIQGLGFIRLQIGVVSFLTALLVPIVFTGGHTWWLLGTLGVSFIVNAGYIAKFTPLWRKQSDRPNQDLDDLKARSVRILAANIKLSNRDYNSFITLVEAENPDILIVVEVDEAWITGIQKLVSRYPVRIEAPLDTGYGLAVYSALPCKQVRVRNLVTEGVPSVRTAVQLRSGAWFRLYAVHPEPPVPSQETKGRDAEIALAGLEAKSDPLPAVIAGDLNDVAWSSTTRRFQRISGLLDPRVGRGFYNTFNALSPVFRWPLDHLFHDAKFRLIEMRRLPAIGSDHFPMLFEIALTPFDGDGDLPELPKAHEEEEAKHLIAEAKREERTPIGTDWEKS